MLFKTAAPTGQLTALVALFIIIVALLLTVSQSYFNSSEINSLVEQAEEHGLEYEVVIHNQFTNSYSFSAARSNE
ncbi:MAG TPA: hypothetical protein VLQ20_07115 [Planococcus sp. (in: firmicutes)]|nr:hypothetical protein [Planococcus sp. (in: firmicutes)]